MLINNEGGGSEALEVDVTVRVFCWWMFADGAVSRHSLVQSAC